MARGIAIVWDVWLAARRYIKLMPHGLGSLPNESVSSGSRPCTRIFGFQSSYSLHIRCVWPNGTFVHKCLGIRTKILICCSFSLFCNLQNSKPIQHYLQTWNMYLFHELCLRRASPHSSLFSPPKILKTWAKFFTKGGWVRTSSTISWRTTVWVKKKWCPWHRKKNCGNHGCANEERIGVWGLEVY